MGLTTHRGLVLVGQGPFGKKRQQEPECPSRMVLPSVGSFPPQPEEVGTQAGQGVMLGHPANQDLCGSPAAHVIGIEVHVTVPARVPLVPYEGVLHTRRYEQELARREQPLLWLEHEVRLAANHPYELEIVDHARSHPRSPRVIRDGRPAQVPEVHIQTSIGPLRTSQCPPLVGQD
jgi:hypothetical protein